MSRRIVYHVQPAQGVNAKGWEVIKEKAAHASDTNIMDKERAKDKASELAENYWVDRGIPTQVIVHNLDGEFEEEWTYGDDPYPPEG